MQRENAEREREKGGKRETRQKEDLGEGHGGKVREQIQPVSCVVKRSVEC